MNVLGHAGIRGLQAPVAWQQEMHTDTGLQGMIQLSLYDEYTPVKTTIQFQAADDLPIVFRIQVHFRCVDVAVIVQGVQRYRATAGLPHTNSAWRERTEHISGAHFYGVFR